MIRLLRIAAFLAITVGGTWLWLDGGNRWYANNIYGPFASTLYDLVGLDYPARYRLRFINWIPFLALMAVTPRLSWRRRGIGTLAGLVVLLFSHAVTNAITLYILGGRGPMPIWVGLVSDGMPLVLWAVIARDFVTGIVSRAVNPRSDASPPQS